MAEPSPTEPTEGQEPTDAQGQVPDQGTEPTPATDEPREPKSYPESYVRQLRREAAESRKRQAELEEQVQEAADRDKSEAERLTEKVLAAERDAGEAKVKLLRYEIAAEHDLGMAAAQFLTGTTREEMELRAEELTRLLAERGSAKPAPTFGGGARPLTPEPTTPEEAHQAILLKALGREPTR